MNNQNLIKLSKISRTFVIGFLVMMILTFLLNGTENSYYNINLNEIDDLYWQLSGFLGVSLVLSFLHKKFSKTLLSLLISMLLLMFLFMFSLLAPAYSLIIGSTVVAVPALFFSVKEFLKPKTDTLTSNIVISGVNVLLFVGIVVLLILKYNYVYPIYNGINTSGITNDPILFGNRKEFLIYSIAITVSLLLIYFLTNKKEHKLNKYIKIGIFAIVGLLVTYEVIHLSYIMVARVKSLYVPTFDFGLFTQMFYNMKNFNGMVTTLERSELLSHMAVHISPIYYLILPVFMIFPNPETLQIAQVVIVAIGVIPIYLISKEFKFSSFLAGLLIILYIFHPAIISSSFYDMHENCFLAPLILFVIYFMIKQRIVPLIIFVLLTLLVKEDAFFYIVFIGLFFFTAFNLRIDSVKKREKNIKLSIAIILLAGIYFIIANHYLSISGEGAMFWRYKNLNAYTDLGTKGIVISVLQNPSYLLATMFTSDKIYHLLIVVLTLGALPLLAKSIFDYLLFVPLIVFNFATTYGYQHQFGFQYYYGSIAILIFMTMLVLKDKQLEEETREINNKISLRKYLKLLYLLPLIVLTFNGVRFLSTRNYNIEILNDTLQRNEIMTDLLKSIPKDKSILATGYLTTYLADREILYDIQYYNLGYSDIVFDYILLDLRVNPDSNVIYQMLAEANNYELSDLSNEYILVFVPVT